MLELSAIAYGYPDHGAPAPVEDAAAHVLRGASLRVRPGERVGLLGPNGSGKSTLLKCACGQLRPTAGTVTLDGSIAGCGEDAGRLHRAVGIVGQDPDNQMVASTVFEEVAFGPCNLGLPVAEVHARVASALSACDLEGFEARDVATLSGGQRQRVAMAGAVAMGPAYLLCDEPCSMLDPRARRDLLATIARMARGGCGVLHVTHELAEVMGYDRAAIMREGRIAWEGTPAQLLLDEEACDLAACLLTPWLRAARGLVAAGLLPASAPFDDPGACAAIVGCAGEDAARAAVDCVRGVGGPVCAGGSASRTLPVGPALSVRGVSHAYGRPARRREPDWALRDVDLALEPGEVVLVAGRTGSGKSTLARIAAGLVRPTSGTVDLGGAAPRPGEVGCAFQRAEDQLFADTVLDDVAFGPLNRGRTPAEADAAARRSLGRAGLDPGRFGAASPFSLSGGQMRRAALAGVLALEAPYLVLDEPTVGLDACGLRDLEGVLAGLAAEGTGVAIVSHDVGRMASLADRAVLLSAGRVLWSGPAGGLIAQAGAVAGAGLAPDGCMAFLRALEGRAGACGAVGEVRHGARV